MDTKEAVGVDLGPGGDARALPATFFDLGSGLAGDLLHELSKYALRLAALAALLGFLASCAGDGGEPADAPGEGRRTIPTFLELVSERPCSYLGTFHRDSRARIERLRMCGALSQNEWKCAANELAAIDEAYTARCEDQPVSFGELQDAQRRRYASCTPSPAVVECGVLSAERSCFAEVCG